MPHDDSSPAPYIHPSRRRPSFSESGRKNEAPIRSTRRDRSRSRDRRRRSTSSTRDRAGLGKSHGNRRKRSISKEDRERSRRKAPRSISPLEDENVKRRTGRSCSKDRSIELHRRQDSRERKISDRPEDSRPRDTSRERRPRNRSRDRRRDSSRDRKPRDRSKDKDRHRDRDRKSRRSASPLPYRSSHKRRDRSPPTPRRHRRDSRSPTPERSHKHKRPKRSPSSSPAPRNRKPLPSQEISFRGTDNSSMPPSKTGGAPPEKQLPNFKPTGLLAKEANLVAGTKISLKYHEPPEARKPPSSAPWRLFIFKGTEDLGTVQLSTQSCWLLGRATEVADIVLGHPSCSSQHAAIQFRHIVKRVEDEYGVQQKKGKVKPYVIDLESSNGTFLNDERIEGGRYVELRDKDLLKFGASEREYVVMLPPPEIA